MSAPSIPNLLSLRGARGGRGGRGGRGRGSGQEQRPGGIGGGGRAGQTHEATVQGTDTDAAVSRLSAVDIGYLDDPYARYFVQSIDGPPQRRLPIINRGTYTRTTALGNLVQSFLSRTKPGERQIISLGAGTDTRAFRLFSRPDCQGLVYHEIDFEVICSKKLRITRGAPLLSKILPGPSSEGENSWTSRPPSGGEYHCHGLDLRQLSADAEVKTTLPGLRTDIPTLILSECCLCYLSPSEAGGVLEFFTSRIAELATVIYEPISPDDAFGKVMVSNLAARNIRMPTLDVYREPRDQEARLRQAGFGAVRHGTIYDIWETWVGAEEKERVDGLEGLDELEEWKLLAGHYIVVWGSRGEDALGDWANTAVGGGGGGGG